MALNEEEKNACRYYLGYPQISTAAAISLGVPDKTQLNFVLELNMQNVLPVAEKWVRRALQELQCIEDQLSKQRQSLELRAVTGAVHFRGGEGMDDVWFEYRRWVEALSDTLGAPPNPFSNRMRTLGMAGGVSTGGVVEPH